MADNYLEKRMEDMKAGRLKPTVSSTGNAKRKGYVDFPFPPRRVLMAGRPEGVALDIMRALLKTGSKVALFDSDKTAGEALAYNEGVRFHNVDVANAGDVSAAFANLTEAWRDIDILISAAGDSDTRRLADLWSTHRRRFPVPFGYGGRFFIINPADAAIGADLQTELNDLQTELAGHRIAVNSLIRGTRPGDEMRDAARTCLALCLPGCDFIRAQVIPL